MQLKRGCLGILLLLSACISVSWAIGNCTNSQALVLARERSHYEIRGLSARVRAALDFQPLDEGELQWNVLGAAERNKSKFTTTGSSLGIARCTVPASDFFGTFESSDPWMPGDPNFDCPGATGVPCGALSQVWLDDDFDCFMEESSRQVDGVNIQSITTHAWLHSDPSSFRIAVAYEVADDDLTYQIPRRTIPQTVVYLKDRVKLTYFVQDLPWKETFDHPEPVDDFAIWNDISFFSVHFTISATSKRDAIVVVDTDHEDFLEVFVNSVDGRFNVSLRYDFNMVVGNKSYVAGGAPSIVFPISFEGGTTINTTMALTTCPIGVGHWDFFEYDPSIVALFAPEPENPDAPPQDKKGLSQGAIAGISLGAIVLVGGVVAGLAVLSVKSSSFKKLIRPFSKRSQHPVGEAISPSSPSPNPGWVTASKPPQ